MTTPLATSPMRASERADRAERTHDLLDRIHDEPGRREELIDRLIEVNMPVARSVAARYRRRGIPAEDLEQVAYLALVRVAHSYDETRGHDFLSYAVPSIRGEIRRYFRDQGWMVRPPRSIQEMQSRIVSVESDLASQVGHPPTSEELAAELDEPVTTVVEAQAANGCFAPTSLDRVGPSETSSLADRLGDTDTGLKAAEARVVLGPVVRRLTRRERRILQLRFIGQRTQQEIADDIGVTQMQVSRLLAGLLRRLRSDLEAEPDRSTIAAGRVPSAAG